MSAKKTVRVSLFFSEDEYEVLQTRASGMGTDIQTFIRQLVRIADSGDMNKLTRFAEISSSVAADPAVADDE